MMDRVVENRLLNMLAVASLVLCIGLVGSIQARADEEQGTKALGIRRNAPELKVRFDATESSYEVDETIQFRIEGSKDFFLYLFSINRELGRAVLLIPSEWQEGNKYKAKRSHIVPNPSIEFYADRPGVEEVVMIASTKYLELRTTDYNKLGAFLSTTPRKADEQIKALRIRPARPDYEIVDKKLLLRIEGKPGQAVAPAPAPVPLPRDAEKAIPFIACDREVYNPGDVARVVFGADQAGWVHIYAIEPSGERRPLKKQKVTGRDLYHIKLKADNSLGAHTLMAVYTRDATLERKAIPRPAGGEKVKQLRIRENAERPPYAIYRLFIQSR